MLDGPSLPAQVQFGFLPTDRAGASPS
jgi:hypothetical protein